jgi:hypothetical protein
MVSVSKKWIKENVNWLSGFGGQITLADIDEIQVPKGGFDTTLTAAGKDMVEAGLHCKPFNILLPGGLGWATATGRFENYEDGKEDL